MPWHGSVTNRGKTKTSAGSYIFMIDRGRGKQMLLLLVLLLVTVLCGTVKFMDALPQPELVRVPVMTPARRRRR